MAGLPSGSRRGRLREGCVQHSAQPVKVPYTCQPQSVRWQTIDGITMPSAEMTWFPGSVLSNDRCPLGHHASAARLPLGRVTGAHTGKVMVGMPSSGARGMFTCSTCYVPLNISKQYLAGAERVVALPLWKCFPQRPQSRTTSKLTSLPLSMSIVVRRPVAG